MKENETRSRLRLLPLLAVLVAAVVLVASALAPRYLLAAKDKAMLSDYHSIDARGGKLPSRFSSEELDRLFMLMDTNHVSDEYYTLDDWYNPWESWEGWYWQLEEASGMGLFPDPLAGLMLELPYWGAELNWVDGYYYYTEDAGTQRETLQFLVEGWPAYYSFHRLFGWGGDDYFGEMEFYASEELLNIMGFDEFLPRADQLEAVLPSYQKWLGLTKVPDWKTGSYERYDYHGAYTYSELAGVMLLVESSITQLHFYLKAFPLEEGWLYVTGGEVTEPEPSAEATAEMEANSMLRTIEDENAGR